MGAQVALSATLGQRGGSLAERTLKTTRRSDCFVADDSDKSGAIYEKIEARQQVVGRQVMRDREQLLVLIAPARRFVAKESSVSQPASAEAGQVKHSGRARSLVGAMIDRVASGGREARLLFLFVGETTKAANIKVPLLHLITVWQVTPIGCVCARLLVASRQPTTTKSLLPN